MQQHAVNKVPFRAQTETEEWKLRMRQLDKE